MCAQEVVISNPKRNGVIGTVVVVIAASNPVRSLEGAVKALNDLLERAKLFRNGIIIGKADNGCDFENLVRPYWAMFVAA